MRRPFDIKPGLVGLAAGALDGVFKQYLAPKAWWAPGAYRLVLVGGGLAGYGVGLNDDVSYTMQSTGLALLASQVAPAIGQRSGKALLGADIAQARIASPAARERRRAAGCASCAADALAAAPAIAAPRAAGAMEQAAPGLF